MANYRYTSDLINTALFAAGEPNDGTSDFEQAALVYLNRAYQALWMGGAELDSSVNEEWIWLMSSTPATIKLHPIITTGTVNVTNNSASVLFSSAPVDNVTSSSTAGVSGWFFKVNDHADIFRIYSHTVSATSATLDSPYTGTTNTVATYTLFDQEYTLPSNVLRLMSPMRVYRENRRKIDGVSLNSLEREWPLTQVRTGVPYRFAQIGDTKVRFSHCGMPTEGDYIRIDFDYLQKPADLTDSPTEEPLVPLQRRRILSDFATFFLMMDKSDNRADGIALMARAGLKAMAIENRANWAKWAQDGNELGHIAPRPPYYEPRPLLVVGGAGIGESGIYGVGGIYGA